MGSGILVRVVNGWVDGRGTPHAPGTLLIVTRRLYRTVRGLDYFERPGMVREFAGRTYLHFVDYTGRPITPVQATAEIAPPRPQPKARARASMGKPVQDVAYRCGGCKRKRGKS